MPAEAVHLSALADSMDGSAAAPLLRRHAAFARLGAVFVDLAYFDRFTLGVLRYLLRRPVASSPWGGAFHLGRPVALGRSLLRRVVRLRADPRSRLDGDRLLALALGYFSHLAVDSAIHPLVNRLAAARALRLRDTHARQHTEVEKFQSILFHEERLGFDFMGRSELADYIAVSGADLLGAPLLLAEVLGAVEEGVGHAPAQAELRRWLRGYRQYGGLISSPLGKTILPARAKDAVRAESYQGCDFPAHFRGGVVRSQAYIEAAFAVCEAPGEATEAAFATAVPEGPIDDGPPAPSAR